MRKLWNAMKIQIKRHWIKYSIVLFAIGPLMLNVGLYLTDCIYDKYGLTLTARGLGNQEWFDFLGTYLSILIAFMGICIAWKSSDEAREKDKKDKLAQEYGEHLEEEKQLLIDVCHSFNTDVIYKSILELNNMDTRGCQRVLQNARERVLNTQVEFELLTDIAQDFKKCEKCSLNPCYDKENMIAIRNLYYEMQELYLELLQKCDTYVRSIENQRRIDVQIQNDQNMISLLQQKIVYAKEVERTTALDDIKRIDEDILRTKSEIETLNRQRIDEEELKKLVDSLVDSANMISQNMKPLIISYSKSYIDWKKKHKTELLQEGKIQYVKYPGYSETSDLISSS